MNEIGSDTVQGGLETPVTETPAPAPASPFASSSLAAELRAQAAAKALAEKGTDTMNGMNLPATLAASVALLRETQASVPRDRFEVRVKAAKLQRLAAHVFALSQSPPPPRLDHATFWKRDVPASALAYIASSYPEAKNP